MKMFIKSMIKCDYENNIFVGYNEKFNKSNTCESKVLHEKFHSRK